MANTGLVFGNLRQTPVACKLRDNAIPMYFTVGVISDTCHTQDMFTKLSNAKETSGICNVWESMSNAGRMQGA